MKIILLGGGTLGLRLLEGLLDAPDCEVVGVLRWGEVSGRRYTRDQGERELAALIAARRLTSLHCRGANSPAFARILARLQPDVVMLGNWGEILKAPLLGTPGVRFVNCHPSLLPRHRGSNPYASAIREGETRTGVSFHLVDEGIDTGPLVLQASLALDERMSGGELRDRCARRAKGMIPELLAALSETRPPRSQSGASSYFPRLRFEDGLIDWRRSATRIHNQIRGLRPWLLAYTYLPSTMGRLTVTIHASALRESDGEERPGRIVESAPAGVWVATGERGRQVGLTGFRLSAGPLPLPGGPRGIARALFLRVGRSFAG